MFRDEPETVQEKGESKRNPKAVATETRGGTSRDQSRTRVRSSSNLRTSLSNLALDTGRKSTNLGGIKSYLGRDGGGTRSGQGSPFGSDDETENESPKGITLPSGPLSGSPEKTKKAFSSSLARALRGELDDPNRKMADALGDQSDAEVEEADLEIGTQERVSGELQQILDEERRERSHRSIY
ncbi:hypothetical protein CLAIMM_13523 [Cladophialophora immunda]|nr:hypothetical protein CLAIMM_13523 [Cladophialophora immunda]